MQVVLVWLAASVSGREMYYLSEASEDITEMKRMASLMAQANISVGQVWSFVLEWAEMKVKFDEATAYVQKRAGDKRAGNPSVNLSSATKKAIPAIRTELRRTLLDSVPLRTESDSLRILQMLQSKGGVGFESQSPTLHRRAKAQAKAEEDRQAIRRLRGTSEAINSLTGTQNVFAICKSDDKKSLLTSPTQIPAMERGGEAPPNSLDSWLRREMGQPMDPHVHDARFRANDRRLRTLNAPKAPK